MDGLSDESERDATTEDLPSSGKRIRTQDCRDEGSVDFFGPEKYRKMRKHEDFIGFYSENHPELDGKHSDLSGREWGLMMIYVLLVIACDSYFRWDV